MPKILVNFKRNKDGSFKILDESVVFADMPIAIKEFDEEFETPIGVNLEGKATVVEKSVYEEKNKLFKLKINEDNSITEDENGFEIYLPKDTNISELMYLNGQIVRKMAINNEENNKEEN